MKTLLATLSLLLLIVLPPSPGAGGAPTHDAEPKTPTPASVLVPAAGDWLLTLNASAVASCLSQRRFTLPSSRIFDPTRFSDTLTVIDDDSFRFRDDIFTRVGGTNRFTGSFSFPETSAAQAAFYLTSATTMRGQLVADYRVDTTRCSETVQFVFRER